MPDNPITLTPIERTKLINQYRILAFLDHDQEDNWKQLIYILEFGLTREYHQLFPPCDEMSAKSCEEVCDILDMFQALKDAYDEMDNKEGINPDQIAFSGFDGNHESDNLVYADFMFEDNKWSSIKPKGETNSHIPMMWKYRAMLREWRNVASKYHLTREDVIRIINAE